MTPDEIAALKAELAAIGARLKSAKPGDPVHRQYGERLEQIKARIAEAQPAS